jgi:hypothetical protein
MDFKRGLPTLEFLSEFQQSNHLQTERLSLGNTLKDGKDHPKLKIQLCNYLDLICSKVVQHNFGHFFLLHNQGENSHKYHFGILHSNLNISTCIFPRY